MHYFDNAASTKTSKTAAKEALNIMLNLYGNPSSIHCFGLKSEKIIENSKRSIAKILNCDKDEIFFTSGATESINTALIGVAMSEKKRKTIITTTIEHSATKNTLAYLENLGFKIKKITPINNIYLEEDFEKAISDDCFLVSFMHVNNETGLILPVEEIAKKIKSKFKDVIIHIDAAQSFCKLRLDVKNIDLLSASGHKINAPKGIGLLYIKTKTRIKPLIFGGGQQKNLRSGTQPTELIRAFEVASLENYDAIDYNLRLYEKFKKTLIKSLEESHDIIINSNKNCAPYIVNISVEGIKSQPMLQFLEGEGFFVSSGAACSKNNKQKALLGFSYPQNIKDSAIRISFDKNNTTEEIIELSKNIKLGAKKILKYK